MNTAPVGWGSCPPQLFSVHAFSIVIYQEVEKLIMNNMDEIVVEILMTLKEERSATSKTAR